MMTDTDTTGATDLGHGTGHDGGTIHDGATTHDGGTGVLADAGLQELISGLIEGLQAREETIATAESLTGGLIGATLTSVPGVSAIYRGGIISYATDLKGTLVGVTDRTLSEHGAVSQLTAVEMALGVARRCDATWGVAVTGVAGPDPQEGHPAGTVYTAVARNPSAGGGWDDQRSDSVMCVRELSLAGSRGAIREQTVRAALRQAQQVCLG